MTSQNIVIACAVTAVVAGGMGYMAGSKLEQRGQTTPFGDQRGGRGMMNRDQVKPGTGAGGMGRGAIQGEVTAKDDKTLTVKLSDGSSKIIILSEATVYRASAESSLDKVEVGTSVAAFASASSDGTTVATSIEINPLMLGRMSGNK